MRHPEGQGGGSLGEGAARRLDGELPLWPWPGSEPATVGSAVRLSPVSVVSTRAAFTSNSCEGCVSSKNAFNRIARPCMERSTPARLAWPSQPLGELQTNRFLVVSREDRCGACCLWSPAADRGLC